MSSITVVIPIRGRPGAHLKNCLRSLELQTKKPDIIVADYGSTGEDLAKIVQQLRAFEHGPMNIKLAHIASNDEWSLARARNIGIRRTKSNLIACVDIDLILGPDVIRKTVKLHGMFKKMVLTSTCLMHREGIDYESIQLPEDYQMLIDHHHRRSTGSGGYMSFRREWAHMLHGFDERMIFWGAEDDDFLKRMARAGCRRHKLDGFDYKDTEIIHQYHIDSLSGKGILQRALSQEKQDLIEANREIFRTDNTLLRNHDDWGYSRA